jgi:hypothetical protein
LKYKLSLQRSIAELSDLQMVYGDPWFITVCSDQVSVIFTSSVPLAPSYFPLCPLLRSVGLLHWLQGKLWAHHVMVEFQCVEKP